MYTLLTDTKTDLASAIGTTWHAKAVMDSKQFYEARVISAHEGVEGRFLKGILYM